MDEIKPALVTDCRDMKCPIPVILLKRGLAKIDVGEVLELVANDPDSEWDIPNSSEKIGAELLKSEKRGADFVYYLRRTR